MAKGQKLALRANIFNILNHNTVLDVTQLSGPNFNHPTTSWPAHHRARVYVLRSTRRAH